ncbi:MAG: eukaryotic-like serine/threonine-protein kinase [Blastocatellia bacterium]|nr:eukaryotic-like serine/threonine-protein kinase [Blastocatellia bacterium]
MIGTTVSHYRILEKLGEGGMGVVYAAEDLRLGRMVAIKFLSASSDSHHFRARFLREARSISLLSHPNIATLFDYGETEEEQPFIVMELLRGKGLNELLAKSEISLAEAVAIIARVADALSDAHAQGIVHRDIKPSNIIINERGLVKVLDFGLAKQIGEGLSSPSDPDARTLLATRTQSDVVVGTPLYLSPEQATSGLVDGRSDIFALGALLYEAISGRPAFAGSSVMEIGAQVIHVDPPPPSRFNKRISKELDRITLKALEKKPEARYQRAEDLCRDLEALLPTLEGSSTHRISRLSLTTAASPSSALVTISQSLARPRLSIFSVVAVLCLLGLAGWVGWQLLRPAAHKPTVDALRWYERGTNALRDGAYFQASQMLQEAVKADDKFALAHARLAEAYIALDNSDGAKDELLAIQPAMANASSLSKLDALRLTAVNAMARRNLQEAINAFSEIIGLVPSDEQAQAYVDLGRAYESNEQVDKAIENYLKAIELDGNYATAYLRVGILYSRGRDSTAALSSLDRAESLYKLLANTEGKTEVLYRRAITLRRLGRHDESRAQFQKALDSARDSNNDPQHINVLLGMSTLDRLLGNLVQAQNEAREAVTFARQRGLETLAADGIIELGNAMVNGADYAGAEQQYNESLELAIRNKTPRNEAFSRQNLGICYIEQRRTDEGLKLVEQALAFFRQGSYKSQIRDSLSGLGRAYRQKGDYESALKSLEEKRELSAQSGDQNDVAYVLGEIGSMYAELADYRKALDSFEQSRSVYTSLGEQFYTGYNLQSQADIYWKLGQVERAKTLLNQASGIADKPPNILKHLQIAIELSSAQIALSERRFTDAEKISASVAKKAISAGYKEYPPIAISTQGIAKVMTGQTKEGLRLCNDSVSLAQGMADQRLIFSAQLARTMALYMSGDMDSALSGATELTAKYKNAPNGVNVEGVLQASWVAALASARLKNDDAQQRYELARSISDKLEQAWGTEVYKHYRERTDIKFLTEELNKYNIARS